MRLFLPQTSIHVMCQEAKVLSPHSRSALEINEVLLPQDICRVEHRPAFWQSSATARILRLLGSIRPRLSQTLPTQLCATGEVSLPICVIRVALSQRCHDLPGRFVFAQGVVQSPLGLEPHCQRNCEQRRVLAAIRRSHHRVESTLA